MEQVLKSPPLFTDDFIVFGILAILLALIFYTSSLNHPFWKKFYTIFPALLMCYLLPSILSSLNIIATDWNLTDASGGFILDENGEGIRIHSSLYKISSRFLLPAALILLTLSIDLKALLKLGRKALIMFFAGTVGVIIGGPVAILIVSIFAPEVVGGAGFDAAWRGLSTLAGSWIGGGANQTAMLELYQYNPQKYGAMVLVDIVIANIWMAILLFGINKKEKIDTWLGADNTAIEDLKDKVSAHTKNITRVPELKDYIIMLGVVFGVVAFAHWTSIYIPQAIEAIWPSVGDGSSMMSTFGDGFFWMVTIATIGGVVLSFTPARKFEGVGASKLGSLFIYILVATIGMKMDLGSVLSNPGLFVVGLIWMSFHALILMIVAYVIKAPYFFVAVGSMANIGGAASAPIVASAFHASLASVGVLLAILGYIIGTYGAIISAVLMEMIAPI
ncbi:MAG: DUF819 family protein [Saprospiraceae bacterium]|nr:MAG: hypothetical protein UZ09_BCD002001117 [Bacteroidetes bacterium OLB9]MCO6464480.1 DUF819 family protein [Saprospiraceae bacterium]